MVTFEKSPCEHLLAETSGPNSGNAHLLQKIPSPSPIPHLNNLSYKYLSWFTMQKMVPLLSSRTEYRYLHSLPAVSWQTTPVSKYRTLRPIIAPYPCSTHPPLKACLGANNCSKSSTSLLQHHHHQLSLMEARLSGDQRAKLCSLLSMCRSAASTTS